MKNENTLASTTHNISINRDQMKQLAADNLDAARKSVNAFNRKVRGLLSEEECYDLTMEAYNRACSSAHTFDHEKSSFRTWFSTVAHNVAYNYVQKKLLEVSTDFDSLGNDDPEEEERCESMVWLSDDDRRKITDYCKPKDEPMIYEARRKKRLQKECWRDALAALGDREQVLLYMRYDLHMTGEEMAEELGLSHDTLRVALSRAVKSFKIQLEQRHYKEIDEWTWRHFDEDNITDLEDENDVAPFFGGRSETNG